VSIAKKYGARVLRRQLGGDFAAQRNFGLRKARGDWVLFLDADERVSREFSSNISSVLTNSLVLGYSLKRREKVGGKVLNYGEARVWHVRIVKRGKGKWVRSVHERLVVSGEVARLAGTVEHHSFKSIWDMVASVNKWSTLHARENNKEGKLSSMYKIYVFPAGHFVRGYFVRLGILDGMHGLVFALLMSFHSFLAWSKLWIIQND
jgi:glycosyltransferase involved in cell wall biosynthesis